MRKSGDERLGRSTKVHGEKKEKGKSRVLLWSGRKASKERRVTDQRRIGSVRLPFISLFCFVLGCVDLLIITEEYASRKNAQEVKTIDLCHFT